MPSTFPGAIDSFTDPLSNSPLNSPSHSTLHSDINDAVEKVETYMGLVKVIPTSVSSAGGTAATLNTTTGTITVGSANTSVTVNGAFSSLYANYLITWFGGTASTSIEPRLTLGASAASYYGVLLFARPSITTPTGAGANNIAYWPYPGLGTTSGLTVRCELFSPALAVPTAINASIMEFASGGAMGTFNGYHDSAVAYTSFTFTASTGTFTGGSIRVYGYRN